MSNLNLKGFTKIKEDKHHVVLKHSEGHEIKISKAHMGAHYLEAIKSLPLNEKGKTSLAEKAQVPKLAEGGEVDTFKSIKAKVQKAPEEKERIGEKATMIGLRAAEGGEIPDAPAPTDTAPTEPSPAPGPTPDITAPSTDTSTPTIPDATAPNADTSSLDQAQKDLTSLQAQPVGEQIVDRSPAAAAAKEAQVTPDLEKQQEQNVRKSAHDIAAGQQEIAAAQQESQKAIGDLKTTYDKQVSEEDSKVAAAQKDFADAKIDPSRYYSNQSTGQKISTAIGLLLGGLGAGGTGGRNLAAEFLQKQVNDDIDAQKEDLGKKKTILSAAIEHQGSVEKGTQFARALMLDQTAAKIGEAVAKSSSQQAVDNGQQAILALRQQSAAIKQQMAADTVKNSVLYPDSKQVDNEAGFRQNLAQTRALDPKLAKDKEERYIPGIGVSQIKVPDKERAEIRKLKEYNGLITKAQDFTNKMGTVGALTPENRAEAETLKNQLIARMNDTTGLTRLTHNEVELYRGIVGSLGSYNLGGLDKKLKTLKESSDHAYNAHLEGLGITPFKQPNQDDVALQWALAHPEDPRAAKIKQRLGR